MALAITSWAQGSSAIDQLKADPRKAYGTDYPYEFATVTLTKAPRGYKPFYISHYGRHGSRYYWNAFLYREMDSLLTTAHRKQQLTAEGEKFYQKFKVAKDELETGVSELTDLGWEQSENRSARAVIALHPRRRSAWRPPEPCEARLPQAQAPLRAAPRPVQVHRQPA